MRKHNRKFAQRWTREKGDRSNFPQMMAHAFVKDKGNQMFANRVLALLFKRSPFIPKPVRAELDKLIERAENAINEAGVVLQGSPA